MSGGINDVGDTDDYMNSETEDNILKDAELGTGEKFNEDDEAGSQGEAEDEETGQDEPRQRRQQGKPQARESREQHQRERVDRTDIQSRIPKRKNVDYVYDQRGNVIDPRTQEIIFENGSLERELFTNMQNATFNQNASQRAFQDANQKLQEAQRIIESYKRVPSVGDQLKLSPEDQVLAFQHMSEFRSNPKQAMLKLLHRFQVDGGDLSDIFDNVPKLQLDALEAKLGRRIDEFSRPQLEQRQSEQEQQQLQQKLEQEVAAFFESNPEAELHKQFLASVIDHAAKQGQQLSLEQAWIRVIRFAQDRQLDMYRSFGEQLQPNSDEDDGEEQRPAPQQRRTLSLPRGNNGAGMQRRPSNKPDHELSSKDIVRDAMRDAGFTV